jgi:glycosyltransferase involved in cell wall biosynthesis
MMNSISFFIPAYNCSETVAESVDSIMETNFSGDDELIIVNDFSNDGTATTLRQLKEKYPVIVIIEHTWNKGGASARNTAVEIAKHELLFCLDADNVLEKNSIEPLKNELLTQNADIASFQEMRYFNTKNRYETRYTWQFLPRTTLADFIADNKNPGSSGNYLFTKNSWLKAKGYPEFAGALDTWGFGFRQLAVGSKLISLPGSYYFHRYGTNSYYIRDMSARTMSIVALQIILPFYHLILPDDLDYIMSKENRFSWFDHLGSRTIRIVGQEVGVQAVSIDTPPPYTKNSLIKKMRKKIKELLSL